MKCPEARELLSALLDEALSASERQAIEAHLAACAECRRELEALRGTVTLLGRLPPVHAPAGFVDRVMEQTYRPSWPRRVVAALFRPLRVKLPLEAAAVVLVGISALYVYQRAPEVQHVAREETRKSALPAQPPAPPAEPSVADSSGSAGTRAQEAASQPQSGAAEQEVRQEPGPSEGTLSATPAAPPPTLQRENAATPPASTGATAPGTAPEPKVATKVESKKEAFDQRRGDTMSAAPPPGTLEKQAQSAEPPPSRDAAGARGAPTPSPPAPARPATAEAPPPEARGRVGGTGSAPSAAPAPEGTTDPLSAGKSRSAARLMRASDASGRLVVSASEPAEVALDALLGRLGGTRVARRLEGPQKLILVDVVVAAARYPELLEGLGKIGRWTIEHEPKTLPSQVRIEVAVTVER